jgi:predicted acetyltransferase
MPPQDFIRPANKSDAQAIHRAHMQSIKEVCGPDYTREQIRVWGERPFKKAHRQKMIQSRKVWVVEVDGLIEGFCQLDLRGAEAGLDALYLTKKALGRGLGGRLLDLAINSCRERKINRVLLASTLTSFGFYKKAGFNELPSTDYVTWGGVRIPCKKMELWLNNAPPTISLVRPHRQYIDTFKRGLAELSSPSAAQSWYYLPQDHPPPNDMGEHVDQLNAREFKAPPNFVTDVVYWAISDGEMAGRISLRLKLNKDLKRHGGHIGYIVRPSFRRQGIAKEMLRQILMTPYAERIGRLLLTCDDDNLGSVKTIEALGGVLSDKIKLKDQRVLLRRYWISLPSSER